MNADDALLNRAGQVLQGRARGGVVRLGPSPHGTSDDVLSRGVTDIVVVSLTTLSRDNMSQRCVVRYARGTWPLRRHRPLSGERSALVYPHCRKHPDAVDHIRGVRLGPPSCGRHGCLVQIWADVYSVYSARLPARRFAVCQRSRKLLVQGRLRLARVNNEVGSGSRASTNLPLRFVGRMLIRSAPDINSPLMVSK